ncbi:Arm DNA-binding domain-containing protein [Novosphingobium sp.]|uniref:Arm DNA-binding domain-containing protein n=1 Tax=Novosphingobium sp. TaxID=1874826 RepID=UPI0038BA9830
MGKLSAIAVKNLKEPGRYSDGEGLILKLAAQGRGSWVLRVQADGKRRAIGLGTLADVGLSDARESARAIRKQMKSGVDVVAERKKVEVVKVTALPHAVRTVTSCAGSNSMKR